MNEEADCQQTTPSGRHRTLRLALAMRGGVSLAVWIGGAVAEIDLFRRACNLPGPWWDVDLPAGEHEQHHPRAVIYRSLLALTKYRDVEVDILAGASAGGLNAVLYGLAQSCGRMMDEPVRRTWVDHGGMWDLLREPGFGRVPSLLKGDGRLFEVIRATLGSIADPTTEQDPRWRPLDCPATDRVTVELAATLLDDIHNPERDNRARFSFVRTPGALSSRYTTIPGRVNEGASAGLVSAALDRLALAARATSSFPGAFEPADIYAAPEDSEDPTAKFRDGCRVNMSRAFLYSRNSGACKHPFNVVDGGIYDNIPIGRTIRAIQRSPVSQPSERWLIYLDPEPPTPSEPTTDSEERKSAVSWIPVIRSSIALKQRNQTAANELSQIRDHNDTVLQTQGRQEALAAALHGMRNLRGLTPMPGRALELPQIVSTESYVQCRIAMDAERVASLLTDPWTELCRPPRESVDYTALDSSNAVHIKDWLAIVYNEESSRWDLSTDIYAMLDWIRVLVAWVHALEDLLEGLRQHSHPTPTGQEDLGKQIKLWKHQLYRCLAVLIEAKHRTVDLPLVEPLSKPRANATYDVEVLRRSMIRSHNQQRELKISRKLAGLLWNPGAADEDDASFYNCLGEPGALGEGGKCLGDLLRWVLDGIRHHLGAHTAVVGHLSKLPADTWLQTWNESTFAQFYKAPLNRLTVDDLSRLFAMTGGPAATPLIAFEQITGDEQPEIDMPTLEQAARARQLSVWLRRLPEDEHIQRVLSDPKCLMKADAKLAGNVFNRFGGFLLGRWRENDWQWGRLDAAAGIARILNQTRGDDRLSDNDMHSLVAYLQESIVEESAASTNNHGGPPIVASAGADGLNAISPHYRFSLVSRTVPLVHRALLPPKGSVTTVAGASAVVAQFVIRPLAVPLTLIADPLRLTFAFVVITAAATLLGAGTSPAVCQVAYSVIVIMVAGFVVARAQKAGRRWSDLSLALDELAVRHAEYRIPQLWKPIVDRANKRRRRLYSWALGAAMLVAAGYHLSAMCFQWPHLAIPAESFTISIVGVMLLQNRLNKRSYRMEPARQGPRRRKILGALTGGGALGVIVIGEINAARQAHTIHDLQTAYLFSDPSELYRAVTIYWIWDQPPETLIVAGVAAALLIFVSLWGWTSNRWAFVWMCVGAALAATAQWYFDDVLARGWALWDLLPALVWMIVVGTIAPKIPHRQKNYGETGHPELIPPGGTATSSGGDTAT